jgi:hypothetical protein
LFFFIIQKQRRQKINLSVYIVKIGQIYTISNHCGKIG